MRSAKAVLFISLVYLFFSINATSSDVKKASSNAQHLWLPFQLVPESGYGKFYQGDFYSSRHLTRLDVCDDSICDQILRQAQGLSRLKLVRRYVRDTISTLDKLVTAMDAELIANGIGLKRALGNNCRMAQSVLKDVIQDFSADEI